MFLFFILGVRKLKLNLSFKFFVFYKCLGVFIG